MAKTSKKQMDKDERKVIASLEKNAKESIDNIARKCGFSRQKVWRIIKRLEKSKIIWGYSAVTDSERLGFNNYIVLIKKTNEPVAKLAELIISREIEKKARELKVDITQSEYIHGKYDWGICFSATDLKEAKRFCEALNITFHKHIGDLILMERIFSVKKCGIKNPHIRKLKEFL
ncbi:MAG: Lrp/AsnC family transcriptional regulator [Thermoplasmatales archaeon]|nr:MAG: Lrp/AsnC family transcriptional regulator [Thermoplasmatales archaeon]